MAEFLPENIGLIDLDKDSQSFKTIYNGICRRFREKNLVDEVVSDFMKCKTDLDRIIYVSTLKEVQNLSIQPQPGKDRVKAMLLEDEHDEICTAEKYSYKAKLLISKSIQTTPSEDVPSLSRRYMKRGWACFTHGEFTNAFEDAQRSLSFKEVPTHLLWNSYEIIGHCYAKENQNKKSETYFKQAIEGLRKSECSKEIKAAVTMRISSVFKNVKGRRDFKKKSKERETENVKKNIPQVSFGQHQIMESASSAVEIVENEERGRGIFATKDFKPGDTIMVEEPFASALSPDCLDTHCFNCFSRFCTPLPCPTCSLVWYCSDTCLNEEREGGLHAKECNFLSLLYDECIGVMALLLFRILQTITWKNLKTYMKENVASSTTNTFSNIPNRNKGASALKQKYSSRDYRNTLDLVTNTTKRSFGDLFKRSLIGFYITKCLEASGYFESAPTSDELLYVASIALRLSQSSSCNAYGITEYTPANEQIGTSTVFEFGGAIYPTISLTNHSCNPNTMRYCVNKTCVLKVLKTIKKGTEVFDNYGPRFQVANLKERQENLKLQYKFDCQCEACANDWPVYPHEEKLLSFVCPAQNCNTISTFTDCKNTKCGECGNKSSYKDRVIDIGVKLQEHAKGLSLLNQGHTDRALHVFINHQIYLDKFAIPPGKYLTDSLESLRRSYFLQGNVVLNSYENELFFAKECSEELLFAKESSEEKLMKY